VDLDKLPPENASQNKCAGWPETVDDAFRMLDQKVGGEIGADQVEFRTPVKRQADQVLPKDADALLHLILNCVRPGHTNGSGVAIQGLNRLVAKFCRRNGENSRAGTYVQE